MHAEDLTLEEIGDAGADILLDFRRFCAELTIRTKDADEELVAFTKWWPEQLDFERNRTGRDLVLKTRQIGFTTLELARDLQFACTHDGVQVVVVGHDSDEIERLFQDARRWALDLAAAGLMPAPQFSTKRELVWRETASVLRVIEAGQTETAGDKRGRSGTIHRLHLTEVAFWGAADATMTALVKAVPRGGEVVIESTANGVGNRFHRDVKRAVARELLGYRLHFWPWFIHDEYVEEVPPDFDPQPRDDWERHLRGAGCSDAQIAWWRKSISDLGGGQLGLEKTLQESPVTVDSAFRTKGGQYISAMACDRLDRGAADPIEVLPIKWTGRPDADAPEPVDELVEGRRLGSLWIYEEPDPLGEYALTADIADGGGCLCAGTIVHRRRGHLVAAYADADIDAGDFGLALAVMGWLYNTALIAPERNNAGLRTLRALTHEARYPRIYRAEDGKLGWYTSPTTRPPLWDDLRRAVEDGDVATPDRRMIGEARALIIGPDGKPMHGPRPATDDLWTAWAISLQLRLRVISATNNQARAPSLARRVGGPKPKARSLRRGI